MREKAAAGSAGCAGGDGSNGSNNNFAAEHLQRLTPQDCSKIRAMLNNSVVQVSYLVTVQHRSHLPLLR